MVHSTATRAPPHQVAAIGLQPLYIALGPGVLILPYHHCAAIAPQVHSHLSVRRLRQQVVLNGNIEVRVGLSADNYSWHNNRLLAAAPLHRAIPATPHRHFKCKITTFFPNNNETLLFLTFLWNCCRFTPSTNHTKSSPQHIKWKTVGCVNRSSVVLRLFFGCSSL